MPPCTAVADEVDAYTWKGEDEFTHLKDRIDADPIPLPEIHAPRRIVLVRHGQSTWNAEGRIQGSTDFSELTPKGQAQAETTYQMLVGDNFDKLYHSPLRRAAQTAELVWGDRAGPVSVMPLLREVDLYAFQGLMKADGKALYGDEYVAWQRNPADFRISEHRPVRELWYRASLAWQHILADPEGGSCALLVAHNAVNQALINTALGLPPTFFRRFLQSNAASTVLDFSPNPIGGPPIVTVDRLNQSPGRPFEADGAGVASSGRLILIRHAATHATEDGLLPGTTDDRCSALGEVQAHKAAEFLMDVRLDTLLASPMQRAVYTSGVVAKCQGLAWDRSPVVQQLPELMNMDLGSFSRQPVRQVQHLAYPEDAEDMNEFWERTGRAWEVSKSAALSRGGTVAVVAHAAVNSAMLCHCLGLEQEDVRKLRMSTAGITVIDFPNGSTQGVIRCHNYTAHLGRWAVPISRDDEVAVCGIDGCF